MNREDIRVGIHNFFVSLELIPVILYKFITAWLSINSKVSKASELLMEKLLEIGLPEETCQTLTKEYKSAKDYIFEELLKRKSKIQTSDVKKTGGFRRILIKALPGGQLFLRIKAGNSKDFTSAIFLDVTKIIILVVGVSRVLERDVYWVTVCIASYVLYSSLFGLASELIDRKRYSAKGLLGSVVRIVGEALSDTKVIAIVGLALSSHSILGAPFVPLYHQFPHLDIVEHYISGFGVGLFAIKAYRTFIRNISYSKAMTIFGSMDLSHQISLFEASAELPFMCYSTLFVGLVWEALEEIVENFTGRVVNVFFWNGVMDLFVNLLGAVTAYALVCHSTIIKKRENSSKSDEGNAKVDQRTVKKASDRVLTHLKGVMDSAYSESSAKDYFQRRWNLTIDQN